MSIKKKILFVVGTMILVCCIFAGSYAFWTITKEQNETNNLVAACLDLDLIEETGTFGVNSAWPITDTEGMALEGYSFKIKNNCSETVNYIIGIDSLEIEGAEYLDYQSIKVSLDSTSPKLFSNLTNIERDNVRVSKQLEIKSIEGNTTKSHNIKLWIKEDADVSEQSKQFKGQVFITGGQGINVPSRTASVLATGDISKTAECEEVAGYAYGKNCKPLAEPLGNVTYKYYADGTLEITGTGEMKDFDQEPSNDKEDRFTNILDTIFLQILETYNYSTKTSTDQEILKSSYVMGVQLTNYESLSAGFLAVSENLFGQQFSTIEEMYAALGASNENEFLTAVFNANFSNGTISSAQGLQIINSAYNSGIKRIIIGEGVTNIGDGFLGITYGISYLGDFTLSENVTLPASMKQIGENAFQTYKINVILNNGLEKIGEDSLNYQTGVLHIPDSVKSIGIGAFGHSPVTEIYLPNNDEFGIKYDEQGLNGVNEYGICSLCENLQKVYVPKNDNLTMLAATYTEGSAKYDLISGYISGTVNYTLVMPIPESKLGYVSTSTGLWSFRFLNYSNNTYGNVLAGTEHPTTLNSTYDASKIIWQSE